jgi:hypothetical protein
MPILGVGVLGVTRASGVIEETVGVSTAVGVRVFCPERVGVRVKVGEGIVGVGVGGCVGVRVGILVGTGLAAGANSPPSIEHAQSSIPYRK